MTTRPSTSVQPPAKQPSTRTPTNTDTCNRSSRLPAAPPSASSCLHTCRLHARDYRLDFSGQSGHSTIFNHQNHVTVPQSTWTMGDHQGGLILHQFLKGVEDRRFSVNV